MKALTLELIFYISLSIAASMVYWNIYPQYHEFCISWLFFGCIASWVDVIKKMIRYRREKESS